MGTTTVRIYADGDEVPPEIQAALEKVANAFDASAEQIASMIEDVRKSKGDSLARMMQITILTSFVKSLRDIKGFSLQWEDGTGCDIGQITGANG